MLNRTRVGGKMDIGRLGQSMARPGMDTRTWVSLAIALGESNLDPLTGVYVDVQLVPTGEKYTARVGAIYAGNGFGLYAVIHKDDELVIAIPGGEAMEGPVVVQRLWNGADLPPVAQAQLAPNDVLLVVEQGQNLRLKVQGAGQIFLEAATTVTVNCPDVRLGDAAPMEFVARADKVLSELTKIQTHFTPIEAVITGPPIPEPGNGAPSALQAALAVAINTPIPPNPNNAYPAPASPACETTRVK